MSHAPIGVFDSGLGGLTVVRQLLRTLPAESLVYVGDTARVPYGSKSPETVRRYAVQIGEWLVEEGAKLVVVACNTATAHALPLLRDLLSVPVIGVIGPGAKAAAAATHSGRVGVIGTVGTIGSGAYERALRAIRPTLEVHTQACPLFVPIVEEGWVDHPATALIAREYLASMRAAQVDTVVLGCTHYPLLRTVLAAELGPGVTLIDSADETVREVAATLAAQGIAASDTPATLTSDHAARATLRVVVSDAPQHFQALANRFLDRPIDAVEHVVFT